MKLGPENHQHWFIWSSWEVSHVVDSQKLQFLQSRVGILAVNVTIIIIPPQFTSPVWIQLYAQLSLVQNWLQRGLGVFYCVAFSKLFSQLWLWSYWRAQLCWLKNRIHSDMKLESYGILMDSWIHCMMTARLPRPLNSLHFCHFCYLVWS